MPGVRWWVPSRPLPCCPAVLLLPCCPAAALLSCCLVILPAGGEAAQETHKYMSLPVMLPGPYLEEAVRGMAQNVGEYCRVLDEVEQVGAGECERWGGCWGGGTGRVLGE